MHRGTYSCRPVLCLANRLLLGAAAAVAVLFLALPSVQAQEVVVNSHVDSEGSLLTTPSPKRLEGNVVIPTSSQIVPADVGKKAHTNFVFIAPTVTDPLEAPPYGGYAYETPTSLGCVYGLVASRPAGCNPNGVTSVIAGGSEKIAIVDAYDDPEAPADLAYFSAVFGLPYNPAKFQVVYAGGSEPPVDYTGGWETEESLDIEYAHAMAPNATLYLVEAQSNYYTDLFAAVTEATNIIQCGNFSETIGACGSVTGKGEVSMSWGGGEFSGETSYDTYLNQTNVVFFASSGDSPGPIYPSTSPNAVAVGGTSIRRSAVNGNYMGEAAWMDGGSGPSLYESIPSYQSGNASAKALWGASRGTPDVAAVANPYTGVWVYDSFPNDFSFSSVGWWIIGGTSAAAPIWTGVVNNAGSFAASSTAELTKIYADGVGASYNSEFHDETNGFCYYYMYLNAGPGYDGCTGWGSPFTTAGK